MMKSTVVERDKRLRFLQTVVLVAVLVYLAARTAGTLFSAPIAVVLLGAAAFSAIAHRGHVVLPAGAHPVRWGDAPELVATAQELLRRAGIDEPVRIYAIPSRIANAVTTRDAQGPIIAYTTGILQRLNARELRAVTAHEISHIRNGDLRLFALVSSLSRGIQTLSRFVIFGSLFFFPIMVITGTVIPLSTLLYLAVVPAVGVIVQLGILRTREFRADLGAVELSGDADALATALGKLEYQQNSLWRWIVPAGPGSGDLFRSHPDTAERVRRLRRIAAASRY